MIREGTGREVVTAEPVPSAPAEMPRVEAAPRGIYKIKTFRSLRNPDFRLLWAGTVLASLGQWVQQITVGWLAYEMTGSPAWVGLVNGVRSVPLLFLGPFGGVAADRGNRKHLMMSTQAGLVVLTFGFGVLLLTGHANLYSLIAFTFLSGIGWALNMPVRQSVVPSLVPRDDVMNAMALNAAGNNVTRVLGPSIGGVLIATLGSADNFLLQSAIYVGVVLMIWRMNIPFIKSSGAGSVKQNLREGASYIWHHPTLRTQMALALVPMLVTFPYTSLMPIFAGDVLQVGSQGYGLLMAAPGIGAVVGTLTVASLGSLKRKGLLILSAVLIQGLVLILVSQTRALPLSLICLVLFGSVQMVYMTMNQTIIQLTAPPEMRGRVAGIYMLNQGMLPFGSLMAGGVATVIGVPNTILLQGIGTCLLALVFLLRAGKLREV